MNPADAAQCRKLKWYTLMDALDVMRDKTNRLALSSGRVYHNQAIVNEIEQAELRFKAAMQLVQLELRK